MSLLHPKATASVLEDVREERGAQDNRWGQQDHTPARWLIRIVAAFSAAARAGLELDVRPGISTDDLRRELIQVAAVAVAWVEAIDRAAADSRDTGKGEA